MARTTKTPFDRPVTGRATPRAGTALLTVLGLSLSSLPSWAQEGVTGITPSRPDLAVGMRTGVLHGQAESDSKPTPTLQFFLRHRIAEDIDGEAALGYGRMAGADYATDFGLARYTFRMAPVRYETWHPYVYTGAGILRYDLDKISAQRTNDVDGISWGPMIPVGVGVRSRLSPDVSLDLSAGYTHTFMDGMDSVNEGGMTDGFWGLEVAFNVGIGDLPLTPTRPFAGPPDDPTDTDRDGLTDDVEERLYATDPRRPDTDGDGTSDLMEIVSGRDPLVPDEPELETKTVTLPPLEPIHEVVGFGFDSAELTPTGRYRLRTLAKELTGEPAYLVEIHGHADPHGDAAYNRALSRRRASTVERFLIANGVAGWRISIQAFGEELADDGTDLPPRRVEIYARPASQAGLFEN